jgi:uncharacterized delta-60 repeat protein
LLSAGILDPTFGNGGKVTTEFSGPLDIFTSKGALQGDGKVVVAGNVKLSDMDATSRVTLARYTSDGRLDPAFGSGGQVITDFGGRDMRVAGVAVQSDGKIVIGGPSYSNGFGNFALARYNPDGSLDAAFGTGGEVLTAFPESSTAAALLLQPDGKIVVAGSSGLSTTSENMKVVLARYDATGRLDPSFGTGGQVATVWTQSIDIQTAVLQPDGKIVVGGSVFDTAVSHRNIALARYNSNGGLDSRFGTAGQVITATGLDSAASGLAVQSDGQLIVSGFVGGLSVLRYTSSGSLDPRFGSGGRVALGPQLQNGNDVVLQPDGRIVVASGSGNPADFSSLDFGVVRLNLDGSLDNSFGSAGVVTTDLGARDSPSRVLLQPDGKIVLVGTSDHEFAGGHFFFRGDFALARYTSSGSLDSTFGAGGKVVTSLVAAITSPANDVAVQSDGKIVAVGSVGSEGFRDFALARYNADGSLDTTFGTGGRVMTDFGGTDDVANAIAVQRDGKLVVVGSALPSAPSGTPTMVHRLVALARYNADGSLDSTFGTGGKVTTDFGPDGSGNAVAVLDDGRIIVADGSLGGSLLARYRADGSLDKTFGLCGMASLGVDNASRLALQPDGRIVVAGERISRTGHGGFVVVTDLAVARLNADGTLDPTFGTNGLVVTSFGSSSFGSGSSDFTVGLAVQADGKIVAAGLPLGMSNTGTPGLVRYDLNGNLDTTFGTGGRVTTDFGRGNSATRIALQADGRIVVGGASSDGSAFAVERFNSNGSLDTTFGTGGKTVTSFPGKADLASVVLQADGRIVAAGSTQDNTNVTHFAFARYTGDSRPLNPIPSPVTTNPNDNALFVDSLYQDLLGRPADAAGLAAFQQSVDAARAPVLSRVALEYVTSAEDRSHRVQGYYRRYLCRLGGEDEINGWVSALQGGVPAEQVLAAVLGSAEYYQKQGSTNAAWLDHVYQDLFDRNRDPGSQVFLDALNGGVSRGQIAGTLVASQEYRAHLVANTYTTYLLRSAADAEVQAWLPVLAQPAPGPGKPDSGEQFLTAILASGEYFQKHGNTTPTWVMSLYRQLLERPTDTPGVNNALAEVLNGYAAARQTTASTIVGSGEYRGQLVGRYYRQLLGRTASASDRDIWGSLLQSGVTDEQMINGIVSSDEYFQKAGNTNSQWLDRVYLDLLGRPRDPGDQAFLNALNGGSLSRAQAATAILGSGEYRQHLIQTFYTTYLGRSGVAAELNFWAEQLQQGVSDEQVRARILASSEYFFRPHAAS